MENGRIRTGAGWAVILVSLTLTSAACAVMPYQAGRYPGPYAPVNPYAFRAIRPEGASGPAIGRWDNVMLLPAGTPVQVLMFDGSQPRGDMGSADGDTLRLVTQSGPVALPREDVMRVDRLPPPPAQDYGRAAARGAAAGAAVVGVIGLLLGHAPPANVVAASAIMGAGAGVQDTASIRVPVLIYLAPPRR